MLEDLQRKERPKLLIGSVDCRTFDTTEKKSKDGESWRENRMCEQQSQHIDVNWKWDITSYMNTQPMQHLGRCPRCRS
eukprot:12886688-Prorocentrum_lima.AAC.1